MSMGDVVRRAGFVVWRPLVVVGAFLATIPAWPVFEPSELALPVAIVLAVPLSWVLLAGGSVRGPRVGAVLIVCTVGWSLVTRLWASWATPSTVDDVLRACLAVGCVIVLWVERRTLLHRSRFGLALLTVSCAAVVMLPVVGNAPVPDRDSLLPLPAGVVAVAEDAGCDRPGSCQRRFEVVADHGADPASVVSRMIRHLEDRGWDIGVEYQDKACRPLGYVANPYRSCASVLYLPGRGTVEVLFEIYNPREPQVLYAPTV
ncbi:hypothetical protein [Actinocrispum sp. NPDC049592]|uniref:hypothetical protein n=1 Tax=Actinocrispum sp. NPDC049592 TaxID=3154835 RepID=UPI00341465B2